jgi:hypothetical protein
MADSAISDQSYPPPNIAGLAADYASVNPPYELPDRLLAKTETRWSEAGCRQITHC